MIGIIDYDAGNIRSVEKAMKYLGTGCLHHKRQRYPSSGRQSDPAGSGILWRRYEPSSGIRTGRCDP